MRGGSIIPLQPLIQSTDQTPDGPLELRVYPGENCNGSLYLDDGHTFAYQHGEFLRQDVHLPGRERTTSRFRFGDRAGTYAPWWKTIEVVLYGWPYAQADVKLSTSDESLKTTYDASQHALRVIVPDAVGKQELRIHR